MSVWKNTGRRGLAAGIALGIVVAGGAVPAAGAQAPGTATSAVAGPVRAAAPLAVAPAARSAVPAAATKYAKTTANLHLRQRPGTKYASLALMPKGSVVARTGKVSGKWWEVRHAGKTGWASSDYLRSTAAPAAAATSSRWFGGSQALYAKPTFSSKRLMAYTKGTKATVLRTSGSWSEVRALGGRGWIPTAALSKTQTYYTGATILPSATYRWTTGRANVRTGASTAHRSLGILPAGEMMPRLGTKNGWSRVKTSRGTGWIKNTLLTNLATKAPAHLQPVTAKMLKAVKRNFPNHYSSVGTLRSGSIGHRLGLGADFMIRNWSAASGIGNGNQMANYLVANADALGVDYIIWRDRIWLGQDGQWGPYSKGGWGRHLTSRGWNATTMHYDHIHVDTFVSR
jgi:uncharacterized protein YgiM (DUF1202 family)